jgi:hypothetical protein
LGKLVIWVIEESITIAVGSEQARSGPWTLS